MESIFKPNADLLNVIKDAPDLTRDFTLNDYVIILAGTNDTVKRKKFKDIVVIDVLDRMMHTNVIFCNVPYQNFESGLNDTIYNFNLSLYNCCNRRSSVSNCIFYFDVNCLLNNRFRTQSFHLSGHEKNKIIRHIREYVVRCGVQRICNSGQRASNLNYVQIESGFPPNDEIQITF